MEKNLGLVFRTFLLQGYWNFARLQNVGMLYVMEPVIKRIYKDRPLMYQRAKARNLEVFNTHPAMSGYSIGAMIRQEEKISTVALEHLAEEEREWRIIRASTANTAASIGDRLFWAVLKPLSLVFCLLIIIIGRGGISVNDALNGVNLATVVLALIISLLTYNIPSLIVRYKGIKDSYAGSEDNFYGLINLNWNKTINFFKIMGQILVVGIILYAIYVRFRGPADSEHDSVAKMSLIAVFLILSVFMRKLNIPNIYLYIAASLVFGLAALIA